jgi:thiol-disulfide isomerase/thioredoxin/uncharacterized membrane protein YphA (DoxX/SURF4 family)
MDIPLLVGRLLLAAIFAVAGLAKLADRKSSGQAFIDFGVPASLATPLGPLLPLVELAVAVALIPAYSALWGVLGALTLLLTFIVGISINLAQGRKPDCHCFGQLHSAPAGWKTLARNGVLAVLAAFIVWHGWDGDLGPSAIRWIVALSSTQLLIIIGGLVVLGLLAGQLWFLLHLLRQSGRILVRLEAVEGKVAMDGGLAPTQNGHTGAPEDGFSLGTQARTFVLEGLYGETRSLSSLLALGKPMMLLFTDPNCGPCTAMLPEIGLWQVEHKDKLTIALISRGERKENRVKAQEHTLQNVLLQEDWEVSDAYEVRGTPSAVVVRPDGTIGSAVAGGLDAIRSLVSQAVKTSARLPLPSRAPAPAAAPNGNGNGPCPKCGKQHPTEAAPAMPAALEVGEPAPEIKLEDLSGNEIALRENLAGEETLVLFWNPGCGFCQQMLSDIKAWEKNPPEGAPRLLVVSAGTKEANEAMGLTSPVVLDQQFATGRAFGAGGTPSAVLVDTEGRVASKVAVGAPAVLEMAGAEEKAT